MNIIEYNIPQPDEYSFMVNLLLISYIIHVYTSE